MQLDSRQNTAECVLSSSRAASFPDCVHGLLSIGVPIFSGKQLRWGLIAGSTLLRYGRFVMPKRSAVSGETFALRKGFQTSRGTRPGWTHQSSYANRPTYFTSATTST